MIDQQPGSVALRGQGESNDRVGAGSPVDATPGLDDMFVRNKFDLAPLDIPAEDREHRSGVRPIGWLAVSWMLVAGVSILDLRMEAAGSLLAVLVPVYWFAATLAAYQLIDPLLKLAGVRSGRLRTSEPRH